MTGGPAAGFGRTPLIGLLLSGALLLSGCGQERKPPAVADPAFLDPVTGTVTLIDTAPLEERIRIEENVGITLRDGTRLSARVFRPAAAGAYPVIMAFTAYGKDRGPLQYPAVLNVGTDPDFDLGKFAVSEWTSWEAPDPAFWVPEGYVVIYVDSRGYGGSAGDASILSQRDGEDFFDAIEWAGTQSFSNGNVGLSGVSYLAIAQWVAASANPPHLKAITPWEGQSDNYREVLFHGGIPETAFTAFWLQRMRSLAHTSPLPPDFIMNFARQRPLLMKTLQARFQPPSGIRLKDIRVPALICATWSDQGLHTRGSFEGFKQIASEQKWLFTHGRKKWETFYSAEALTTQKAFFDHFLKAADNGFDRRAPVRLEVRESLDAYTVREAQGWPLPDTESRALFLDATSGELARTLPSAVAQRRYNPRTERAEFRFSFAEDTELTGNMKLKLWVSTDQGDDMDLFVGIEKLNAAGESVPFYAKTGYRKGMVAMGWLRASHRELDAARSTALQPVLLHEQEQTLDLGEVAPVEIEILPSSTLFRAGETLRVIVQGRDLIEHPMLAHAYTVNEGAHIIHTGGRYDSHLLVPVVAPTEEAATGAGG
ncbi:MAG: CocE/NonD family hydrolase [Pseudomonadota bacterium]